MITDEELYARFLCGEDDGLRELMDRHMNRLTLFCFTFLHSVTEAEEMALDAFAVVALRKSLWRGGSFRAGYTGSQEIYPFRGTGPCE